MEQHKCYNPIYLKIRYTPMHIEVSKCIYNQPESDLSNWILLRSAVSVRSGCEGSFPRWFCTPCCILHKNKLILNYLCNF